MTLREQIHNDVVDVFLNVDDFGETFTYCPVGGTRRDIVCVVSSERVEVIETAQGGKQNQHIIEIFCSRSSTTGIDDPKLGDGLWRKTSDDSSGWAYGGEASERDENDGTSYAGQANAHTLLFVRYTPYKLGGSRIQ